MTTTRRVLAVGSRAAERLDDALASEPRVEVVGATDEEAALTELAMGDVDAVVTEPDAIDDGSAVADVVRERSDLAVVRLGPVEDGASEGESTESATVSVDAGQGRDRDLLDAVREAVGLSGIEEGFGREPAPVGPLTLYVEEVSVVDADGPPMPPLGYDPDDLVGESLTDYVFEEDHDALERLLDEETDDDSAVLRVEHYDGDLREVWLERRPGAKGKTRLEVFRRTIDRLPAWFPRGRDAEEMLAVLFTHTPIHLFVKDEEGRHVWVSRFHTGNTGDAIGKRDIDFDWDEFAEETYADDMEVIETGEPILNKEEYIPFHDDWNLTSKVPWIDPDGEVRGLVGVTKRVTKRKEYEKRLELENERLERFASIVSHDLRNPINVATGHLELAQEEEGDSEHLDRIERALERMDRITADVLTMAREGEWVTETETVSLDALARRAWDMVDTGEASLVVDADLTFEGDSDRLHHLFENLYRNAVEHGGAAVTVRVGPIEDEGFYVADDGVGIPTSELEHVFETGQTVRANDTGLGLEIVRQVATAHGWEIEATESDAGGACFEITDVETVETDGE